ARDVEQAQNNVLSQYLADNRATEYGERYQFGDINSPSGYQERVPLTTYDDYVEYANRIGAGSKSVLTNEPVRMFELSSGSTAASKLIPYTDRLKSEFQRGIAPWIYNLYTNMPDLLSGPAYWSITPLMDGKRFTSSGIPIGFESDSEYLGVFGRWLADAVMAVPNDVKTISDIDSFRYLTLLHLLRQPELRLISVWNPTFLSLLLAALPEWWDRLLMDIKGGTVSIPEVSLQLAPKPELARMLRTISPMDYESIWPKLRLISCWMDGASASYATQLAEMFPSVAFQGKGLLATEAFVSFPIVGVEGSVLAVNSHFFEFIDDSGDALLAHQIEKGKTYSVVVTTGGGFHRYQLQDVIEVIGHWRQTPRIRFLGKADHISDWFGEKLEEQFVANVLRTVFSKHYLSPAFAMLAPDDSNGFRYLLFIESDESNENLAIDLDDGLRENFHYDYCRRLGQLGETQIVQVIDGAETYLRACQARGQKLGNIKPGILQKTTGWISWFRDSDNKKQTRWNRKAR
ncbi:MAG TPA: GH3 auxin-responsive promoter family protein, partial [Anaerolineales bacterium]|nr:GH3 auxin-responsive promoter family protein [Anaerolineales bacterium]